MADIRSVKSKGETERERVGVVGDGHTQLGGIDKKELQVTNGSHKTDRN